MEICESIKDVILYLKKHKKDLKTIGFVPTMGALHQGHLSLFETSRINNHITVGSIFVNPLQFNSSSDLALYPRPLETDIKLLQDSFCDLLFLPSEQEMYKTSPQVNIRFERLEEVLEGKHRPGHFKGVGLVVSKFFNIIQPDNVYLGQKDLQQFLIIKKMVVDLSYQLQLFCCPTVRESDGLAMSSRNRRISNEKRPAASGLYQALLLAKGELFQKTIVEIKSMVALFLSEFRDIRVEYFEIVDGENLAEIESIDKHAVIAICIAAYIDEVRLIDNIIVQNGVF